MLFRKKINPQISGTSESIRRTRSTSWKRRAPWSAGSDCTRWSRRRVGDSRGSSSGGWRSDRRQSRTLCSCFWNNTRLSSELYWTRGMLCWLIYFFFQKIELPQILLKIKELVQLFSKKWINITGGFPEVYEKSKNIIIFQFSGIL